MRAFISYRRQDSFMWPEGATNPDYTFLLNLKATLIQAGFADVFIDTAAIQAGDHYESRIHQEISDCDVFVAVMGARWLEILREKIATGERDVLVREIRDALTLEKEIIPLLVHGAAMPSVGDLPQQIQQFHYQNAVSLAPDQPVASIEPALKVPALQLARVRRLDRRWTRAFIIASVLAYFACAVLPHIVGFWEFGSAAWLGMVRIWSGFYIWPVFFLPFVLIALYRPLTVLIEASVNTRRLKSRITYLAPLALGTIITMLALVIEVLPRYEVPWSIHPSLPAPGCVQGPAEKPEDYHTLSSYNAAGSLDVRHGDEFWLKDKCWPGVLFYLTAPIYQGSPPAAYLGERPRVQKAFMRVMHRSTTTAPYSAAFYPYVLSFSIMIWLAAVGIVMSVLYVTIRIRRPYDERVLRLPTEDSYLCLTYAFMTLMVWLPFRLHTNYFKFLYSCESYPDCPIRWGFYFNDIVLFTMLFIAYVFLTVGLLVQYRRLLLGFIGTTTIVTMVVIAAAVYYFGEDIARLSDDWQFYVGTPIPLVVILAFLWFQFDPAFVHRRDFKEEIE